jgi:predicted enzyme related to lactoylglutathione lyase
VNNAIEYIEVQTDDAARSTAFFSSTFGWTMTEYGPGYLAFKTPAGTSGASGAFATPEAGGPPQAQLAYITVADIDATLAAIEAAGGKTAMAKLDIGAETGWCAHFTDPSGVRWGLYQQPDGK